MKKFFEWLYLLFFALTHLSIQTNIPKNVRRHILATQKWDNLFSEEVHLFISMYNWAQTGDFRYIGFKGSLEEYKMFYITITMVERCVQKGWVFHLNGFDLQIGPDFNGVKYIRELKKFTRLKQQKF